MPRMSRGLSTHFALPTRHMRWLPSEPDRWVVSHVSSWHLRRAHSPEARLKKNINFLNLALAVALFSSIFIRYYLTSTPSADRTQSIDYVIITLIALNYAIYFFNREFSKIEILINKKNQFLPPKCLDKAIPGGKYGCV